MSSPHMSQGVSYGYFIDVCKRYCIANTAMYSLKTSDSQVVALVVKNPPASAEDVRVQSLGWEDPLKEEKATHANILASRIPWTEEPGRLQPMGSQELDMTW